MQTNLINCFHHWNIVLAYSLTRFYFKHNTGQRSSEESSDDSDSDSAPSGSVSRQDSENEDDTPITAWQPTGATSSLGDWEAHTRGIGSKIMAMMGYEFG